MTHKLHLLHRIHTLSKIHEHLLSWLKAHLVLLLKFLKVHHGLLVGKVEHLALRLILLHHGLSVSKGCLIHLLLNENLLLLLLRVLLNVQWLTIWSLNWHVSRKKLLLLLKHELGLLGIVVSLELLLSELVLVHVVLLLSHCQSHLLLLLLIA